MSSIRTTTATCTASPPSPTAAAHVLEPTRQGSVDVGVTGGTSRTSRRRRRAGWRCLPPWHVSAPRFRDCHLLLNEQSGQILATTSTILRSIGQVGSLQRISDNEVDYVMPLDFRCLVPTAN